MATTFNEQLFEQKLVNLKDTQDAINALSAWCLQHKEHHKKIVICWLHCLKRVKIDVRLSLFYLANDVIQYSKRKHLDFVESWGTALQKATPLVRDDKVKHRIHRIFKIWEERGVYDEPFISDLCGLLTSSVKKKTEAEPVEQVADHNDFQPSSLVRKIKECKVLEENTDIKYKRVKDNKLPLTDAESMRLSLKDRRHGSDVAAEVDSGVKKMEAFVKALESEISAREKLLELLRVGTLFYETQRGEAKIVANAYRNFGGRLKARQKALDEKISNLNSPLPSPDVNAPSPSPDSDLDGQFARSAPEAYDPHSVYSHQEPYPAPVPPVANGADLGFPLVTSSFIGSAQFLDITREVFSNDAEAAVVSEAQPIEVIGTREAGANFDVAEFFKSLMPAKDTSVPPPPMPPVFAHWSANGPWDQPPIETPQSPPMFEKQASHVQPVEYDDSLPVPPVADIDHRTLLPVQDMPPMDMDHREPPPVNMGAPPPMMGVDMDHRPSPGMSMHGMEHPPPILSERGALIAPPPPVRMHAPPPPPPAPVKALLDIDQRNLISLTGSPGRRVSNEGPRNLKDDGFAPHAPQSGGYRNDERYDQTDGYRQDDQYPERGWNAQQPADLRDMDPRIKDNVEEIDMDVSEEDDEESQARAAGMSDHHQFMGPQSRGGHHRGPEMGHRPFGPPHRGHHPGPRPFVGSPNKPPPPRMQEPVQHSDEPDLHDNEPSRPGPSLSERLMSLSAGAKLVAPIAHQSPDKNGFNDNGDFHTDFTADFGGQMAPRPRWSSPRPPRGVRPPRGSRPPRPPFPYRGHSPHRGHPRQFIPRCPW